MENKYGELDHKEKCAVTVRNSANQRLSEISVSLTVLTIFMILVTEIFPCLMVNFMTGGMFDLKNLKGVKICQVNIHSIINKLDELQLLITLLDMDVLCITETWLDNNVSENETAFDNFVLYRKVWPHNKEEVYVAMLK